MRGREEEAGEFKILYRKEINRGQPWKWKGSNIGVYDIAVYAKTFSVLVDAGQEKNDCRGGRWRVNLDMKILRLEIPIRSAL